MVRSNGTTGPTTVALSFFLAVALVGDHRSHKARFCGVIGTSPLEGWRVGTASTVLFRYLDYIKLAIK